MTALAGEPAGPGVPGEPVPYTRQHATELYQSSYSDLLRFVCRWCQGSQHHCADLAAETLKEVLTLWADRGSLRDPRPMLFWTAQLRRTDKFRHAKRKTIEPGGIINDDLALGHAATQLARAFAPDTDQVTLRVDLTRALTTLTDRQAGCLLYHCGYQLPIRDVACLLGLTIGKVNHAIAEAKSKLARSEHLAGYAPRRTGIRE